VNLNPHHQAPPQQPAQPTSKPKQAQNQKHNNPRYPQEEVLSNNTQLQTKKQNNAGGGIRTHEPLQDRSLSPTPLTWLGNPRSGMANNKIRQHIKRLYFDLQQFADRFVYNVEAVIVL
jgi:hypothetical protein